jgi:hypothetical protein
VSDDPLKAVKEIRWDAAGTSAAADKLSSPFIGHAGSKDVSASGSDKTGITVELVYRDRIAVPDRHEYTPCRESQGKMNRRDASADDKNTITGTCPSRVKGRIVNVIHRCRREADRILSRKRVQHRRNVRGWLTRTDNHRPGTNDHRFSIDLPHHDSIMVRLAFSRGNVADDRFHPTRYPWNLGKKPLHPPAAVRSESVYRWAPIRWRAVRLIVERTPESLENGGKSMTGGGSKIVHTTVVNPSVP